MQTDMYNDYDNKCFDYYTTSNFDNRRKKYLISRYTPNASWDYGDTVSITFNIHECCSLSQEQIEELEGKTLIVHFYDNRYELIPFYVETEGDSQVVVALDYDSSIKYFKRGVYHCSIEAVTFKQNEDDSSEIDSCETILSMDKCSFYVQ